MTYDLAIIGGGINGVGIARDAAGRGLKVLLCEKADLASATSSASTKLIHGGLRYLEHYEFALVRHALSEREVLWQMAPHIIRPLRFILPHNSDLRPAWLIRLGLLIYDHIGGRKLLPASRSLDLRNDPVGAPLKAHMTRGFEYSDCWVDDARLVVANAVDAARRGADVRVRTEIVSATRADDHWMLGLKQEGSDAITSVAAKVIVNAAGPWSSKVAASLLGLPSRANVRLIKGSHIVVKKLFDHDRAYIFQNADQRIIFAIPYETDFTLIGTTDVECDSPASLAISQDEIAYLCATASEYFAKPIVADDVVWSYAGVRPLYNDGENAAQAITRDYRLERHGPSHGPSVLNVYGGKLTTYRRLAEEVLNKIADCFPHMATAWTKGARLPGGDFPANAFEGFVEALIQRYPTQSTSLLHRLARAYGTESHHILAELDRDPNLKRTFGADLTQAELEYLADIEWARSADDVLWRRSKLGLRVSNDAREQIEAWFAQRNATSDSTNHDRDEIVAKE